MAYFMGKEFDKKKCKEYKKQEAAIVAAEKIKAAVFDENGEAISDFRNKAETEINAETVVNAETVTEMEAKTETEIEAEAGIDVKTVNGKIKRVFNGSVRIRKEASWSNDAVRGASSFDEKIVTHLLIVEGKPMYKTLDGYYISGSPELVKFIEN